MGQAFGRLVVAHFVAYPVAFLWAVASVPILVPLHEETLFRFAEQAEMAAFLTNEMLLPAAVGFVFAHLVALPWAFAADARRGLRRYLVLGGGLVGLTLLVGASGWLWLLTR